MVTSGKIVKIPNDGKSDIQVELFENGAIVNIPYPYFRYFSKFELNQEIKLYKRENKVVFNPVHPDYPLGSHHNLEVISKSEDKILLQFPLHDTISVKYFPWNENEITILCKVSSYLHGRPILINETSPSYVLNQIYLFPIKYEIINPPKDSRPEIYLVVETAENDVKVKVSKHHQLQIWKFPDLYCNVAGRDKNGKLKLSVADKRHPYFKINDIYKLKITGFSCMLGESRKEIWVLVHLEDQFSNHHSCGIHKDIFQKVYDKPFLSCKIIEIGSFIKLSHDHEFEGFVTFAEIEQDPEIKKLYFDNLYAVPNPNSKIEEIVRQYNERHSFWLISYSAYLLHELYQYLVNQELKTVQQICHLILKCENKIITEGLYNSISDANKREISFSKNKQIVKQLHVLINILDKIIVNDVNSIIEQNPKPSFYEFKIVINYLALERINPAKLLNWVNKTEFNEVSDWPYPNSDYCLIKIEMHAEKLYHQLANDLIASESINQAHEEAIKKLICWYCILYLYYDSNEILSKQHLLIRVFQLISYLTTNENMKDQLWMHAYYIEKFNYNLTDLIKIKSDAEVEIIFPDFQDNFITIENEPDSDLKPGMCVKGTIIKAENSGLWFLFNNKKGYLANKYTLKTELKYLPNINANCTLELTLHYQNHKLNIFSFDQTLDNLANNPITFKDPTEKIGSVVEGIVNEIKDYGVFLITEYGQGLLHIKNILNYQNNITKLDEYFKKGMLLKVILLHPNDGKLDLGFNDMSIQEIYNEYQRIFSKNNISTTATESKTKVSTPDSLNSYKAAILECISYSKGHNSDTKEILKFAFYHYTNENKANFSMVKIKIHFSSFLNLFEKYLEDFDPDYISKINFLIKQLTSKTSNITYDKFPRSKIFVHLVELMDYILTSNLKIATLKQKLSNFENYNLSECSSILLLIEKIKNSPNDILSNKDTIGYKVLLQELYTILANIKWL